MAPQAVLSGVRVLSLEQVHVLPWGTAFLADFGATGVAHARTHDVVERQIVLFKPGWVGVVEPAFFGTVARAAGVCQTPRSIDHSGHSFGGGV